MTYSFGEEHIVGGPKPSDENNVRGEGWIASRTASGYTLSWISGEHGGGELSAEISEEEFERLRSDPGRVPRDPVRARPVSLTFAGGGNGPSTGMARTDETEDEQLARNVSELLGELRVAQAGVQILFGFLLAVVFTPMFDRAELLVKSLHLAAVLLAVLATALLSAPAAWHRVLFREGRRKEILARGNQMVLAGLVCLACAVTLTVMLIGLVVFGALAMWLIAVLVAGVFGGLWFLAPARLLR